ncbi:uncharacterized protein LOC119778093 [Cyprinodon tularosa]|uniref:uncharacterized protein LOC119778093 n=1 Tax=Cyprinodon tularosa TaxID=77115 RepID=UPI0018E26108|nr:uncharacterized protein LOC119778093 [Cyprinodon tularosa]
MYRVAHTTTINNIDLPYYECVRGSNNLEGFHKSLPSKIPGPHCAARPYQVYLISGNASWNADRRSQAVFGVKGQRLSTYSEPLMARLNNNYRLLFGEPVDINFHAPADVTSAELLRLEYLFSQSTGESAPFSFKDIMVLILMRRWLNLGNRNQTRLMRATQRTLVTSWFLLRLTSCSPVQRQRTFNLQPLKMSVVPAPFLGISSWRNSVRC